MSQFQQQPRIDYQGQRVFEQPIQPGVYQEQMPILPQPTFQIGYTGINLAEIGAMAAKAGQSVFASIEDYKIASKNNALQSIALNTENTLDSLYRAGATQEELDKEVAKTQEKIKATLGYDPMDSQFNDTDGLTSAGTKNQALLLSGRKLVTGMQAKNSKYLQDIKTSDEIGKANLASLEVGEALANDPNMPIERFDQGIASIQRILSTIVGKDNPTSSDILAIKNPQDKDTAMRMYKEVVDLRIAKRREMDSRNKALADAQKDAMALEKDERVRTNNVLRDQLKGYTSRLEVLAQQIEQLKAIPLQDRSVEEQERLIALTQDYISIEQQAQLEVSAFADYRGLAAKPNLEFGPPSPEDFDRADKDNRFDSLYTSETVIRNAAIDTPEVRTAYDSFLETRAKIDTTLGKYTKDMIEFQREEAIRQVESKWKYITDSINRDIAVFKEAQQLDANKEVFFERLDNLERTSLDTILGFIGGDRIDSLVDTAVVQLGDPALQEWDPARIGLKAEIVKEWLSFDTPPEEYETIVQVFGGNATAFKAWEKARASYMDIQTKVWGSSDAANEAKRAKKEKQLSTFNVMFRGHTPIDQTPKDYIETADTLIQRVVGPDIDVTDPTKAPEVIQKLNENKANIPADALAVSTLFGSMYSRADNANDLIDMVAGVLPKDDAGNIIPSKPGRWTSTQAFGSFPGLEQIRQDLNNDPEHQDFAKAMVAFALMPPQWREEMISSATRGKAKLEQLDKTLRLSPQLNMAQAIRQATSGGYSESLIKDAKARQDFFKKRVGMFILAPGETVDPALAAFNQTIEDATLKGLSSGLAKPSGVPVYDNRSQYMETSSTREAYAELGGTIALKYFLYNQPNTTPEEAITRATKEAFEEFNSQYVFSNQGIRSRGTVSADMKFTLDTTGQLPERLTAPSRNFPTQSTNSAVLDQNVDSLIRGLPENSVAVSDTLNSYGIGSEEFAEAKRNPFANMAVRMLRDSRAISNQARTHLLSLWQETSQDAEADPFAVEQQMLSDVIRAGRTRVDENNNYTVRDQETTRREMLITVAAIKEASTDFRSYDSKETYLEAVKRAAVEIRASLRDTKDTPSDTAKYTFSFDADGIHNNTSMFAISILRNNQNGNWTVLSRAKESLALAAYPNKTERGNSTNTEILSSLNDTFLVTAPTQQIERAVQALYDRGLLVGDFKYRILGFDTGIETTIKRGELGQNWENSGKSGYYIPVITVRRSPETGQATITRSYEVSPYSSKWEFTKSILTDSGDYADRVRKNTPQFTEEESKIVDKPNQEERAIQRSAADIPVEKPPAVSLIATEKDKDPYILYDIGTARDFYLRVYGPDVAEKLFEEARTTQEKNQQLIVDGVPVRKRYPDFDSWYDVVRKIAQEEVTATLGPIEKWPDFPSLEEYRVKGRDVAMAEYNEKQKEVDERNDKRRKAISDKIASLREKSNNIVAPDTIAEIPTFEEGLDYKANIWQSGTTEDPVYSDKGALAYVTGSQENVFQPEVYFSNKLLEDKDKTIATGVHEFIHVMQRMEDKLIYKKPEIFKDFASPEEKYALDPSEIPAWFAGLKAEYYLETGKALYPVSSGEAEYEDFYSWLAEKDKTSNTRTKYNSESYYGLFHRMLTNPKAEIKDIMRKTLRQIAINSPQPNTGMAII